MSHRSMRAREGHLLIDNRASGPTPQAHLDQIAALERSGVHVAHAPAGGTFESATITCCHCHVIVVLNPLRTRERGYCAKCHHYVCDNPACNRDCRPMQALIDRLREAAAKSLV